MSCNIREVVGVDVIPVSIPIGFSNELQHDRPGRWRL